MKINDKFKEVKLDRRVFRFIQEKLKNGLKLSGHLINRFKLISGEVVILLPEDLEVMEKQLYSFKDGILPLPPESEMTFHRNSVDIPVTAMDSYLAKTVKEFLSQSKNNLCIFEDAIGSSGEYGEDNIGMHTSVLIHNNRVYHLIRGMDVDQKEIQTDIENSTSALPQFVGALVTLKNEHEYLCVSKKCNVKEEELCLISERTVKIIIGAYDGEGYLIWTPIA